MPTHPVRIIDIISFDFAIIFFKDISRSLCKKILFAKEVHGYPPVNVWIGQSVSSLQDDMIIVSVIYSIFIHYYCNNKQKWLYNHNRVEYTLTAKLNIRLLILNFLIAILINQNKKLSFFNNNI